MFSSTMTTARGFGSRKREARLLLLMWDCARYIGIFPPVEDSHLGWTWPEAEVVCRAAAGATNV